MERGLGATQCPARHSTRHSVRYDPWRYQLAATVETFEYTSCRGIPRVGWMARE